ncbi:MAG TPA: hypothetical protein PLY86_03885 [bacterium]|nr:hypothetical protein [bacterium]
MSIHSISFTMSHQVPTYPATMPQPNANAKEITRFLTDAGMLFRTPEKAKRGLVGAVR